MICGGRKQSFWTWGCLNWQGQRFLLVTGVWHLRPSLVVVVVVLVVVVALLVVTDHIIFSCYSLNYFYQKFMYSLSPLTKIWQANSVPCQFEIFCLHNYQTLKYSTFTEYPSELEQIDIVECGSRLASITEITTARWGGAVPSSTQLAGAAYSDSCGWSLV